MSGVTNGMGRYEGEVIQLLSNLGATLLGGEPVGGRERRGGRSSVLPRSPHPLQLSHDKVKFVSKLSALAGKREKARKRIMFSGNM
jgi:hypothetical protein